MKKLSILIIVLASSLSAGAQSGYLGSLNNVSVSFKAVPSIRTKYSVNNSVDEAKKSLRYAYMNYELAYSRVFSKKIELGFGYGFSSMKAYTHGLRYDAVETITLSNGQTQEIGTQLNFLDDPRISLHQFTFDFRYFRLGSLSPTGKYLGFGIEMGTAGISDTKDITVGKRDEASSSGFFSSKYDILESQIYNVGSNTRSNYVQVNANIGRNYPITQDLILGIGMTFPLITTFSTSTGLDFGFATSSPGNQFNDDSHLNRLVSYTTKKYKGISLDLTVKYFF
ncbi:MAG: hypothetical protein ABJG68_04115 [Crocinitomicaceae bacterium]